MKKVLIAGGSGLIGRRLTHLLQEEGYEVMWLSRSASDSGDIKTFIWNPAKGEIDSQAIMEADALITLSGAGVADGRWTTSYKKKIIESRLQVASTLLDALNKTRHHVQCLLTASAIGIYGDRGEELLTESSTTGSGFLSETCSYWESAYSNSPIRTVSIRIGIVLSKDGGALPEMAAPMKAGICPVLGSGQQYMSWIHIDDLCRIFIHALKENQLQSVYNAVAPTPVTHQTFMHTLRKTIAPYSLTLPTPAFLLKLFLGEKSAIVLDSARVSADKILHTGFQFKFRDLSAALKNIYGR
ncbi:MAG: TIGR01777 family protein [Bacteroidetes bacterium]|nr:TIGR01777 family protein [Bacteroidota bacterium]